MRNDPLEALRNFVDPADPVSDAAECYDEMIARILVLSDYAWERRIDKPAIDRWLDNFDGQSGIDPETEKLHALYLLSQLLFFGVREMRVLLRALYRDLFLIPLIQENRAQNSGTRDPLTLSHARSEALKATRFLGVGNPSESGVHLLYYFRQENALRKYQFMDTAQIFTNEGGTRRVRDPNIRRYVFVDDVCGSGQTAAIYSRDFLEELKIADPTVELSYLCVFATAAGLENVRNNTVFGARAKAIFDLDESYKSLSEKSRYFKIRPRSIDPDTAKAVALHYGSLIAPGNGGGFDDGQLLLGFSHNIPDNTLPIIWRDTSNGSPVQWTAAMPRYMKV